MSLLSLSKPQSQDRNLYERTYKAMFYVSWTERAFHVWSRALLKPYATKADLVKRMLTLNRLYFNGFIPNWRRDTEIFRRGAEIRSNPGIAEQMTEMLGKVEAMAKRMSVLYQTIRKTLKQELKAQGGIANREVTWAERLVNSDLPSTSPFFQGVNGPNYSELA